MLGPLPFPYHPLQALPSDTFLKRLARGLPMHDRHTLREYVSEDMEIIRKVGPALVVGDFRLSLPISTKLAGIPLLSIANAYWSPYARQSFIFPEYEYPLSRLVGARASRALFRALRPLGFAAHTRPLNQLLREHGLPPIGHDIREMYTRGDYTVYVGIPELMPTNDLPPHHRYIGAVLWSPHVDPPVWWNRIPTDRPVVYVSLGSSGERDLLPIVLAALADAPLTVVAATAGRSRVERPPANAFLAEFLSGTAAAARACLVVCNGGSPTTYQALAAGVPVLGLASNNMDQHLNMDAVCRAGAGEVLRARGLDAATIRRVARDLIDSESYRQHARKLAENIASWKTDERFGAVVDEIRRLRKTPEL